MNTGIANQLMLLEVENRMEEGVIPEREKSGRCMLSVSVWVDSWVGGDCVDLGFSARLYKSCLLYRN
jgi:hypothetical protein